MKTTDAVTHYGSAAKLAKALGIRPAAVSQWGDLVPKGRAYELQALTNNALTVNPDDYQDRHGRAALGDMQ